MENTNIRNGESQLIPVSQVKQGFNYRRRFNAEKVASLRESIKLLNHNENWAIFGVDHTEN